MPRKKRIKDVLVLLDDEFSSKEVTEDIVGRKARSLFELRDIDVPVPSFIVISSDIFSKFIAGAVVSDTDQKFTINELGDLIKQHDFSNELVKEISTGYSRLSGFSDSWVAVRSSVVLPVNKRNISFAGLLDTMLNVKGLDNVLAAVRDVYASAFTPKVAAYLSKNNMSISDIKVAVVIQKMLQAEASGVVYTIDPISQNPDLLTIETVFGLGNVIANGDITPDQYVIDKKTLEFKEKRIVPQEWMMIRRIQPRSGERGDQRVKISRAWQHHQKLENRFIEELSKISLVIEKMLGEPQDIEWVFESSRLWILQTREVQPIMLRNNDMDMPMKIDQSIIDAAKEIAQAESSKIRIRRIIEEEQNAKSSTETRKEAKILVAKPFSRQVVHGTTPENFSKGTKTKKGEKLILTGIGASQGIFRGPATIINNSSDIRKAKKKTRKTKQKYVMVLSSETTHLGKYFSNVGAIILDTGGITSDIAIMCREMGIPCIVGCHIASHMLVQNESLLVDGSVGAVYGKRAQTTQSTTPTMVAKVTKGTHGTSKKSSPKKKKLAKGSKGTKVSKTTPPKTKGTKAPKTPSGKQKSAKTPRKPSQSKRVKTATKVFINMSRKITNLSRYTSSIQSADGITSLRDLDIYSKLIKRHPSAYISEGKTKKLVTMLSKPVSEASELGQGNPVIVSTGSMSVGQYRKLVKGGQCERWNTKSNIGDNTIGLARMLKRRKELKAFLKAVKHVRNVNGWRNTSIAVDYPGTPDQFIEFKKSLTSTGMRRSSTFKIYMTVNTPSEVMVIDDFIDIGLDGVIVNTSDLAKHMMAPKKDHISVIKAIEKICTTCKDIQVIVQIPKNTPKLLKSCIKTGVHGIAVEPSELKESRQATADVEHELIFS
ncbi:MAG: PEP/pyruvate-binding domain-containing protein [Patescibacteria group bacterium]|nr:PEP/pyruvate-binding domain-containing protein [Patescibacteria group bacterium]